MTNLKVNQEGKVKLFLSVSVLVYSVYVSIAVNSIFPFIAMFFSSIGDIAIMASRGALTGKKENSFDWGVIAFSAAHTVYVYAMREERTVFLAIAISLFIAVLILTKIKPADKKWNYIPYTLLLFTSFANTWFFAILAGIGMVLFLSSDLILSICEEKSPKWQIPIWATYIPAQILILSSFMLVKAA